MGSIPAASTKADWREIASRLFLCCRSKAIMTKTADKTWFLYILKCGDGSLYTGITNDVARRFKQHAAGTASRYTRSRLPVELVYQESQAGHSEALKRELVVKALSRKEKKALIQAGR